MTSLRAQILSTATEGPTFRTPAVNRQSFMPPPTFSQIHTKHSAFSALLCLPEVDSAASMGGGDGFKSSTVTPPLSGSVAAHCGE